MGTYWSNKPRSPTFRVNASVDAPQPTSESCSFSSDELSDYLKRRVPELDDLPPVPPIPPVLKRKKRPISRENIRKWRLPPKKRRRIDINKID